jgi:effector-binding domain-containing protein
VIEEPLIVQTTVQQTAFVHITVGRGGIRDVMGPGYSELMTVLGDQGVVPTGPWFNHHLRMDPEMFDFELSVPVESPIAPSGRVEPGDLAAATVVRTIYHGGFEGLSAAWAEFDAWIASHGLAVGPDLWEVYVTGPESGPDPATWSTQLNRPIIGAHD